MLVKVWEMHNSFNQKVCYFELFSVSNNSSHNISCKIGRKYGSKSQEKV